MSFIARSVRPIARSAPFAAARPLSVSALRSKSLTESTKETLDSVNKSVGKGLASAIEGGETAAAKTKSAVGAGTEEAKQKTEQAAQKGNQAAAGAREKKDELLEKGKSK